ncbi:MAG: arginase family protein, partial [Bacteroidetes bacterium]|nr:arginase family protein [Bacteroidota bacterium]
MIKALGTAQNFLGIPEEEFFSYANSHYVIQQVPYEYTSSYLSGSDKGPAAIVRASQYVELYDEELDMETYRKAGIATLKPLDFKGRHDKKAVDFIEEQTSLLLKDKKFVVSLGAEHTVTLGFVKAHQKFFKNFSVLQIDAHSDLREAYHSNPYSHA